MGLIDGLLNLFERGLETFLEAATNSIPGAAIDAIGGRGGDGVYGSSAENFVRNPDAGLNPVINIYPAALNMIDPNKQSERDAAPVQEVAQAATRELSVEDWFHAARDHAQADALRSTAEARADADIAAGREQSLHALAVDPVGHYAQQDRHATADNAHAEQRAAEDMEYLKDLVAQQNAYWEMHAQEQQREQQQSLSR